LLAELYNSRDIKEAVLCVNELVEGKADMANVFENFLTNSLESKDTSWETLQDLLKVCGEEKVIAQADFEKGARQLLDKLDDLTVDVPKAPLQVGDVLASLLANDMVELKVIAQHILEADPEPVPEGEESMTVDSGVAMKALGATLRGLKAAKGTEETAAAWKATGLDYKSYIPALDREDIAVAEKFVSDYELTEVL
jgi:MA3 domain